LVTIFIEFFFLTFLIVGISVVVEFLFSLEEAILGIIVRAWETV